MEVSVDQLKYYMLKTGWTIQKYNSSSRYQVWESPWLTTVLLDKDPNRWEPSLLPNILRNIEENQRMTREEVSNDIAGYWEKLCSFLFKQSRNICDDFSLVQLQVWLLSHNWKVIACDLGQNLEDWRSPYNKNISFLLPVYDTNNQLAYDSENALKVSLREYGEFRQQIAYHCGEHMKKELLGYEYPAN